LNITENLNIRIAKDNNPNPISLLKKYYTFEFPPTKTVPMSTGEIQSIIISLKSKNSSGYDRIPNKILKLCGNQFSKLLTFIFNKSITMGVFAQ
jgi:hypothetical protein